MKCFLCQKHAGEVASPPGGYIYDDLHWRVCHAPVDKGPLGTLFIESQRHFLDFAELLPDEAVSYGVLLKKLYTELKRVTGAERIYQVIMMEGVPHFHAWLVPRAKEIPERGIDFLAKDLICTAPEARELAGILCEALKQS
jgi:diadenosine tetraphosphate (Ap4A) HIT family hydrolase